MSNLQGTIRRLTVNTTRQFERLGGYSDNMANFVTNTYKTKSFESIINEDGYVVEVDRRNHAQGDLRRTKNPLDIAIKGAGFIPVTTKTGEILYTRDGSFTQDKDGTIVTYGGEIVGGGIQLPINYEKLEIRENGDVYTYKTLLSEPDYHGTIPLVNFANPEGLDEIGANNYRKTEASGEAQLIKDNKRFAQYNVEMSNVDMFAEVNDIMRTNASLQASQTLMSAIDKMYQQAVNLRE